MGWSEEANMNYYRYTVHNVHFTVFENTCSNSQTRTTRNE